MRRHYTSEDEPVLSDYFPELGKTRTFGNMEILDGSNDRNEKEEAICA